MLSVYGLIMSNPIKDAIDYGYPDRPVYIRGLDGDLKEVVNVSLSQIMTSSGPHDVVVIEHDETVAIGSE